MNDINKKKELPIGIQSFSEIRNGNYYYVDKTKYLVELVRERTVLFSRPHFFGKSLMIDTLDNLFSGNRELFKGLYAENHWDWNTIYPVIKFSFAKPEIATPKDLQSNIWSQLNNNADKFNVSILEQKYISIAFRELIEKIAEKHNDKVVILIDEYDKPILDNINKEPIQKIYDLLSNFYSIIKGVDKYIHFAMLIGVSRFIFVNNVFSGFDNLIDVTLRSQYSAICGYTQEELETVFVPELIDVDVRKLEEWYGMYNWTGERVYNPTDILLFLKNKKLESHCSEIYCYDWLVDSLVANKEWMHRIEDRVYSSRNMSYMNIDRINPVLVLFQIGYLTIDKELEHQGVLYKLKYPNIQLQQSLNRMLIDGTKKCV